MVDDRDKDMAGDGDGISGADGGNGGNVKSTSGRVACLAIALLSSELEFCCGVCVRASGNALDIKVEVDGVPRCGLLRLIELWCGTVCCLIFDRVFRTSLLTSRQTLSSV